MVEYKVVIILIAWFSLTVLVGHLGRNKQIGYDNSFLASIILSPVIGYVTVLLSPPVPIKELIQSSVTDRLQHSLDSAKRAVFIGETDKAISLYRDTLNYLENDYDMIKIEAEQNRHDLIMQIIGRIKLMEQKGG